MVETSCAICERDTPQIVLYPQNFHHQQLSGDIFSARRAPDGVHYQIVQCKGCRLIYSNPILEPEEIKNFYKESQISYEDEMTHLGRTYGAYLRRLMEFAPRLRIENWRSLLEIGCGSGFFLEKALALGFQDVYGLEPSFQALEQASPVIKHRIHTGIFQKGIYKEKMFDVICAFQVFDHVSNPNEFLKLCHTYLKEDGYLLLIHHNVSSLFSRILKKRCPIIDIQHIYLYDKKTQKRILEKNGFEIKDVFNVYNHYSLKYFLKMLPLHSRLKGFIFDLIHRMGIDNRVLKLYIGNMGFISKKSTIKK